MVLVVVGVLAAYAVPRFSGSAEMTYTHQADALMRDLRHAQQLAIAWNRPLRFTVTASDYSVACVTAGAAPCDVSPVVDPARGGSFQVSAISGIAFGATSIDLDTLGRPNAAAAIAVTGGGQTASVNINAVGGFVSRTP